MGAEHQGLVWLRAHGRPIDLAVAEHVRAGNEEEAVASALQSYVNPDGGFGNALEPDVRLAGSSVLATTIALQRLALVGADESHPLVVSAMSYLRSQFDSEAQAWDIVPTHVDDAPHAPWWDNKGASSCLVNPRAEIVGYMYRWPGLCDGTLRQDLTASLRRHLLEATELEMHDILVFDRLVSTPGLPKDLSAELMNALKPLAIAAVATEPAEWDKYGLAPLTIVKSPDHPFAGELVGPIEANLDYLKAKQCEDGSWTPSWTWHSRYPDDWQTAEPDIRSQVTADVVAVLSRFGRTS